MSVVRWAGRGVEAMFAAMGLLLLLVVATPLDVWWAHAYAGTVGEPKGQVLIVLGAANDDEDMISYSSYWRARYALRAWQAGGFEKLVISGGGGPGMLDFLVAEGIPREAIVAEWGSTSTRENGIAAARLVANMPGHKVLLTSDFHMYRAVRVFQKLGVDVIPEAVPDVMKTSQHWIARVAGFDTLAVETVKILGYRSRGWI